MGVAVFAVAGDVVGYESGRRLGRPWLQRRGGRLGHSVERAEQFYDAMGVGGHRDRAVHPLAAHVHADPGRVRRGCPTPAFLLANLAGALVWGSGLVLLGFAAHGTPWLRHAAYVVAAVAIAGSVVGTVLLHRRTRPPLTPPAARTAASGAGRGRIRFRGQTAPGG